MSKIYIFLDYTNTTNEVLKDEKLNQTAFDDFYNSILLLEEKSNTKANLIIATGNNISSATKILNALKKGFNSKGREDILNGIAYEYGGYFLSTNLISKQICFVANSESDLQNVLTLSKEYNIYPINDYKTVLSFETENPSEKYLNFIKNVKKVVKNSKLIEFNDKFGCGIDIVPMGLSKANFIENFLKNRDFSFLVVGGDGKEDVNMLNTSYKDKTYFVGFKSANIKGNNIFLSDKDNIDGITDAIKKLANTL